MTVLGKLTTDLDWVRCKNDIWCPLFNVDLSRVNTFGVYIIWHTGSPAKVVRLGQGYVADRLEKHRNDKEVTGYGMYGSLMVTWAAVSPSIVDGVERYLAEKWKPLVGMRFPDVPVVPVNSPF